MKSMWVTDVPKNTNPLKFIVLTSRPYWLPAVSVFICAVIGATFDTGMPYILKLLVNATTNMGHGGSTTALWLAGSAFIGVSFASDLLWRTSGFIGMRWATGVRATARYVLTSFVLSHSQSYFSDRFAGSISSKISQAANSAKDLVETAMWQLTLFAVTIIAGFIITFLANPLFGFIFLGWVGIITPLNVYLARRRVPLSTETQRAETLVSGATVDTLTNIAAVEEYARHGFELSRIKEFIIRRRVVGLRNWRYSESVLLLNNILQTIFTGSLILSAIYFAVHGTVSPGDVVLLLSMIMIMQDRLTFIGNQMNHIAEAWGQVVESLTDIIRPYEITDTQNATPLILSGGSIHIQDLTFLYHSVPVFEKLDIYIPQGQKVGLVGRSGAGKSTLMKLLLRHYNLGAGKILIDNTDIASVTKDSLREAIAVVPQEPLLFHRSIFDNIAYGRPEATKEEVEHAAKLAQAHDFIVTLPDGYGALVGERGVKLSGGQRQRVVIARAILKNAPILLLDEATSSLDSESEVAVQKALHALMESKTVIAIAHRLSTLREMDRLIVMDNGKIIEDGTHDELIEKGGLYSELWRHQAGGFLEE